MILTAVFHMLKTGEVINPCDLNNADISDVLKQKQLRLSAKKAADFLVALVVCNI